jgi:hypothetical protein
MAALTGSSSGIVSRDLGGGQFEDALTAGREEDRH